MELVFGLQLVTEGSSDKEAVFSDCRSYEEEGYETSLHTL